MATTTQGEAAMNTNPYRHGICPKCKSKNLRWIAPTYTNKCSDCGTLSSKQGIPVGRWI
jgi:hypothetical protein